MNEETQDQYGQSPYQFNPSMSNTHVTGQAIESNRSSRAQPPLSPTERTVLNYLIQGLTERQVAEQLDRSHNTIHVHVRNIYRKVGVTSRKMLFNAMTEDPTILRAQKRA